MTQRLILCALTVAALSAAAGPAGAICKEPTTVTVLSQTVTIQRTCIPPE